MVRPRRLYYTVFYENIDEHFFSDDSSGRTAVAVRAEANHSRRRRRLGDVVFNVRLGVCLCSFPPYITLYDPYRTALAPPPPPPTVCRRRRNKNIICQKPPPPPRRPTDRPKTPSRRMSVVGREISRSSEVEKREIIRYIYFYRYIYI